MWLYPKSMSYKNDKEKEILLNRNFKRVEPGSGGYGKGTSRYQLNM